MLWKSQNWKGAVLVAKRSYLGRTPYEKDFIEKFNSLCESRSAWEVWIDFVNACSCAISNATEPDEKIKAERETLFDICINQLGGMEVPSQMLAIIAIALEENPEQDFLGSIFMQLNLADHWKGQFFTPYNVCKLMSELNVSDAWNRVNSEGWISVSDCACGAGATLIAMANALKDHGINYQNHVLFVAQDISRIAGLMCYIQLSLLGCPGYIVIADSLLNPSVAKKNALFPVAQEGQEYWYTPMFRSDVWNYRRLFNSLDSFFMSMPDKHS